MLFTLQNEIGLKNEHTFYIKRVLPITETDLDTKTFMGKIKFYIIGFKSFISR